MATILINAIHTSTTGGEQANIAGIDPTSEDCFIGSIVGPNGIRDAEWNDVGICRGGVNTDNLDPHDPLVADAIETVKLLRKE